MQSPIVLLGTRFDDYNRQNVPENTCLRDRPSEKTDKYRLLFSFIIKNYIESSSFPSSFQSLVHTFIIEFRR
mgnify:CR=1 FL=1